MSDDTTIPSGDFEALLQARYPTFHAIVADARATGDASRLKRFVDQARREVGAAVEGETNAKKRGEIENVLRATEAAAALAVQIAYPQPG